MAFDAEYDQEAWSQQVSYDDRGRRIALALAEAKRALQENDEDGDDITADDIVGDPPQEPDFPYLIVGLAVTKDLIDIAGNLTIIGLIVTIPLSGAISVALGIWCLGKIEGGWWKKAIIKRLWQRYALATVVEFIPFGQMIPATTIFVLMAHYHEKKIVQILDGALSKFR